MNNDTNNKQAVARADLKVASLQAAISAALLNEQTPLAGFVDRAGIGATIADLTASFSSNFRHTFAVKANALSGVLAELCAQGMGAEVASPGELAQALKAGFAVQDIVFDEPAKSTAVIRHALQTGVNLNIDNFQEFVTVKALVAELQVTSRIGFRINPQIGGGSIDAMSTATASSKFGVPLADPGVHEQLLDYYRDNPWLTALHTHVGSQGCPMELMAEGVAAVVNLAEDINQQAGFQQITTIDIGGGLTVNFSGEDITPSFGDYAAILRQRVPVLFTEKYQVLTEFGRSIMAKNGFIAARVEYTKIAGGKHIAITHGGAHVAARTAFVPDSWPLRVTAHGSDGCLKSSPSVSQDIAGPCCFAGDKLASACELPLLERGDYIIAHETGAYYFSNPFYYNSLPAPPVYFYRADKEGVEFETIRPAQTIEQMMAVIG